MLRMNFTLIGNVQSIWFFQWPLFVGIDVYMALDAFLAHVGPTIARHPFSFTFGAFVFAKATLLSLIRREAFALWPSLWTILDVVSLFKAKMAHVARGRSFRWFPVDNSKFHEMFRQIANTVAQIAANCARLIDNTLMKISLRRCRWKTSPSC